MFARGYGFALLFGVLASALLITLTAPFSATAGSRQGAINPQFSSQQLFDFSKQVERVAAQQRAQVFLLARVGRAPDQLPRGIIYTHTAIAVYSLITTTDGQKVPGYRIYNLYQSQDDPAQSELVIDYPVNFFAGAAQLKAGIAIPTMALQKKLLALIGAGDLNNLHNRRYSLLSNPYNSRFQNCTEFTLDVINAAIYQTRHIKQLKANSKAHFRAQKIHAGGFKLTMAAWLMKDLSLADHPAGVQTATFSTIVQYLQDNDLLKHQQSLSFTPDLTTEQER